MQRPTVLALVLAGGKGSRLGALTDTVVKPALPVGGTYRLIDISLSNLAHSHIPDVWMVQQYLPHDLNFYMANGRPWDLDRSHGGLHILPPYQGAEGEGFASPATVPHEADAQAAADRLDSGWPGHWLSTHASYRFMLYMIRPSIIA